MGILRPLRGQQLKEAAKYAAFVIPQSSALRTMSLSTHRRPIQMLLAGTRPIFLYERKLEFMRRYRQFRTHQPLVQRRSCNRDSESMRRQQLLNYPPLSSQRRSHMNGCTYGLKILRKTWLHSGRENLFFQTTDVASAMLRGR